MSDQSNPSDEQAGGDSPGGAESASRNVEPLPAHEPVVVEGGEDPEAGGALLEFPVVAIGASTGGVEAFLELFRCLPADTGMSFVVVQHFPDGYETKLPAILAAVTSMPVVPIENGARPQPDRIYFPPSGKRVTMVRGSFRLEDRPPGERIPMPIDHFFTSLASDQKHRAVGVVLSGADSDGALGLKFIKGEGGFALVQDPDTALVADMPRNSILADHVDLILPPGAIGTELCRLAQQFFRPSLRLLEEGEVTPADEPSFARLLTMLRNVNGVEFRNYKPGTIRRRTARRMILKRIDTLPEYVRLVQNDREELRNLHEDVLINVTRFFRDPAVFDALKAEVLPVLFDNRPPDQQVRIWVAGCAAGEEAYSIAICLLEYLAGKPHEPPIQIFGTDASERSIDKARAALYPESIAKDISPERLRRFFVRTDKGFQISKRVRDLCIFARQNLCNDPPFSRLDVIACRNVLIYLDRDTQQRVITTFHYALRPNGCLMLGRSESINASGLFTPTDRRNRFYMKSGTADPKALLSLPRPVMPEIQYSGTPKQRRPSPRAIAVEFEIQRAADRAVLARHAPPGVLINEAMEVLEVRGRPGPFLGMAPGAASLHLLRMAHPDVVPALRDSVMRAMDSGVPTAEDVVVRRGEESIAARLEVLPIQFGSRAVHHYLVLFAPLPGAHVESAGESGQRVPDDTGEAEDTAQELTRSRRDLTTTRLYLQSLIEERDARNQELTAAYEEIQSSNEELQSTNEELETAKEELQSTNEELQTVNDELRNRNSALLQASNDLTNLLNSVNIPLVMLANDLTIRHFTPPADRLLRLRPADIGRSIGEIRLNLQIEELEPLLQEVLTTLAAREMEVQDRSGKWHLLRLRPYRTAENKIDGVVMLMLDIDQMRRGQEELQQTRNFAQTVLEAVQVPVVVLDTGCHIRSANAAFRHLTALGPADLERRPFAELLTLLWEWPGLRPALSELLARPTGAALSLEHEATKPFRRSFRLLARSVVADQEPAILIVLDDITAQKQAERLLESDRDRLETQVRSAAEILGRTREELRALTARLFRSQEEERRRVARELHDDVSQKLAVIEIAIERLRQKLPESTGAEIGSELGDLRERTAALSDDVRRLSHQLHSSMLDHLGLRAALKSLTEEFAEREGMLATFRSRGVPAEVPAEVATTLYRVAQEALRNVAKHAGPTHVKVTLEQAGEALRLSIRDFGDGFDVNSLASRGLGLVSMEERARLVGGAFSVQSELGQGTSISVTVPLEPRDPGTPS